MKLKWLTNAGSYVSSRSGTGILMDPWVHGGAFLGSWFHSRPLPDLQAQIEDLRVDAILISHLHTDHFDRKFLASYLKFRPDVLVVIPKFAHPWLRNEILRIKPDSTFLLEAEHRQSISVGDIGIRAVSTGPCNPQVCGVSFKCVPYYAHSIDGVFLIEGDGQRIINASDAMATSFVPHLSRIFGECDLLMGHYGSASPFPQAFVNLTSEQKMEERTRVLKKTTSLLAEASKAVKAKYVFPFAGDYILGGRLTALNQFKASSSPTQAVKDLEYLGIPGQAFSLSPYGELDLTNGNKTADFSELPPVDLESYLRQLESRKFPYEHDPKPNPERLQSLLMIAAQDVIDRATVSASMQNASYVLTDEYKETKVTINFATDVTRCYVTSDDSPDFDNVTRIVVPQRLLARLVDPRVAVSKTFTDIHWNQADGGSHFMWERTGQFPDKANFFMSFFGKRQGIGQVPKLNLIRS